MTEREWNGMAIPMLCWWGSLIVADYCFILEADWEREHTKLEFCEAVTPLIREINKRLLVLNPDWLEVETEMRSMSEIRKEQACVGLIIPKMNMEMLIQEIGQDHRLDLEWEPEALEAIQTAAEDYLTKLFKHTLMTALHAGRTHIVPWDMQLVRTLREERE